MFFSELQSTLTHDGDNWIPAKPLRGSLGMEIISRVAGAWRVLSGSSVPVEWHGGVREKTYRESVGVLIKYTMESEGWETYTDEDQDDLRDQAVAIAAAMTRKA